MKLIFGMKINEMKSCKMTKCGNCVGAKKMTGCMMKKCQMKIWVLSLGVTASIISLSI